MTENGMLESVREDDFVEYFLFTDSKVIDNREEELMINSVLREARSVAKKHTGNYLWHRDEFNLSARTSISNILSNADDRDNLPPHLHGISHYGDNIEDEWFIVHLLVQLTKSIEGLVARVVDVDGEFLLIEAAEQLPAWAKPENCDKRVYLYKGLLHIVAPESSENCNEPTTADVSVNEAVEQIRRKPSLTVASPQVQEAIQKKIKGYPKRIQENLHRAKVFLPVGIAAILNHKPNLISSAIQAFCNRDSVDMRACRAMKYFPPENRVHTSITFTKCLYAMLNHSKYMPDRKTGWNLPQPSTPLYKAQMLGIKIACGFEILVSQAKPSSDVEGDKGWHTYLNTLKAKDYFRQLLENSQEYNNLLNRAKEYYVKHRDSMQCSPSIGQEILELTKNLDYNVEDLKEREGNLPPDDDDDWLNVSPEDLDQMLMERYGQKKVLDVSNTDSCNFTRKITRFLEHISDVDGAEFPREEEVPVRPPRSKQKKPVNINDGAKVNFDSNSFSCAVQNILNFVIPEDDSWDLDSDSDMDDYGKEDEVPAMDYGELKSKMEEYMKQMDAELAGTTIGQSFEKRKEETFDDIESFKPVDIDMNALKNILESYKSQMGEAGPSSNMLGPMGVHLEKCEEGNGDSD